MQILFERWGFRSCAYHVPGRLWLLLRRPLAALPKGARSALAAPPWEAREGAFVDYWR